MGITSLCLFVLWSMPFVTDISMCAQHPELLKPWPHPGLSGICWNIRRLSYPYWGWVGFSTRRAYNKDPQCLELACESFTMIVCFLTDNSWASLQPRALVVSGMQIKRCAVIQGAGCKQPYSQNPCSTVGRPQSGGVGGTWHWVQWALVDHVNNRGGTVPGEFPGTLQLCDNSYLLFIGNLWPL